MQSLIQCPNRHFVVSAKLLNFLLKQRVGSRTFFGVRSPVVRLNSRKSGLLNPTLTNTCRDVTVDLRVLHTLVLRIGLDKNSDLPRFLGARNFSTTSSSRKDDKHDEDPNKKSDDKDPNKDPNTQVKLFVQKIILFTMLVMCVISVVQEVVDTKDDKPFMVSWNEFVYQMLAKGEVKEITVEPYMKKVRVVLHDGAIVNGKRTPTRVVYINLPRIDNFEEKVRKVEDELNIKFDDRVQITYDRTNDYQDIVNTILLLALIAITGGYLMFKHGGKFKFDITSHLKQAKFTLVEPFTGKGVRFEDVAGLKEAKTEVMEFVDYLKNPDRYKTLGAKVPRGALLLGPPGCGKTLLAKAVATESNVPFLSMNGSEFIEMLGGLGAARVRDLFKEARRRSPSIIYIDEIDAIGKKRTEEIEYSNSESERTLNQLLVEMDGMTSQEGVIILASTNRSEVLDKALLRPGRFDRHILIDLPNLEERKQIFENHLKVLSLADKPSKFSGYIAYLTPGFSGADIANVCNEAALHAARDRKKQVEGNDLLYAIDRTIGGITKKTNTLTPNVKKVVAYHEAGHALTGWLLEHTDALLKVTIVPRTNMSLGFAQYTEPDQKLHTKEELFQRMCMMLGGRVAESLTFNEISTGAENDLKKVTKLAYHQVQQFGMSPAVGLLSYSEEYTNTQTKKPYSKMLANLMDLEARRFIADAYQATEKLLSDNKDKLRVLAEALLEKETLTYEDVEKLIGPPPFGKKRLIEPAEFEKIVPETESRSPEPSPA